MRAPVALALPALLWACWGTACGGGDEGSDLGGPVAGADGGPNSGDGAVANDGGTNPNDAGPGADGGDMCLNGPRKPVPLTHASIVNGTRAPTHVLLSADQIMAVVSVGYDPGGSICSGTLIAEQTVLTAQHCTEGVNASDLSVFFGQDDSNADLIVPVTQKLEHPTVDTALLHLSFAPATQIQVQPIYVYLGTLDQTDVGMTLEQAGYGQTGSGNNDGRYFVTETMEALDADYLTVNGMGVQGVCFGDSGGPSLLTAPEGDTRVVGDLSSGDATCTNSDDFTRLDVIRPWIEATTGPTPTAGPVPCGAVSVEGSCGVDQKSARYCQAGELQRVTCASGEVCGWSTSASGWRCVPSASDPCNGIGLMGSCTLGRAEWCDRGQLRSRDCAQCSETCLYLGPSYGYDCDPNPNACGDLDYLGHCNGNTSEWCENGVRDSLDCAAQGQVCRYVDSDIGYYCDDP